MDKYVIVSTGREVTIGDKVDIKMSIKHPNYKGVIETTTTLDEELLKEFIKKGKIKIEKQEEEDIIKKVIYKTQKKIEGKLESRAITAKDFLEYIDDFNSWASTQIWLKYVAVVLDEQYEDHISNCNTVFVISPQDLEIHKINKKDIKTYKTFPAFRNIEDAKIAYKTIEQRLKKLYK